MGPLLNAVTWHKKKTTLLDGKRRSGTFNKRKLSF